MTVDPKSIRDSDLKQEDWPPGAWIPGASSHALFAMKSVARQNAAARLDREARIREEQAQPLPPFRLVLLDRGKGKTTTLVKWVLEGKAESGRYPSSTVVR
jgi:hypothetical protein